MTFLARQADPDGPLTDRSGAISAEGLLARARQPGSVLIDIRSRRDYRHAHVPESHSIPAGVLLAGEPPDGDLVLIGADSHDSQRLIEQLYEQGYHHRLDYLEGGFRAWVIGINQNTEANHPWKQALVDAQRLIAGPLLLTTAAATQSVGLLALGFVLLFAPWTLRRSRA